MKNRLRNFTQNQYCKHKSMRDLPPTRTVTLLWQVCAPYNTFRTPSCLVQLYIDPLDMLL